MAPKVPWNALSRRGAFSSKQLAFLGVAALVVVLGIALRVVHYVGQPAEEAKAPVAVEAPLAPDASPGVDAAKSVPKNAPAPQTPPAMQETATAPNAPAAPSGGAARQAKPGNNANGNVEQQTDQTAEQPDLPAPDKILVSREPVEVRSSPSASAPSIYGFPAGRPFRVIGREGGFAHIQDVRSGARGWIDEAALTAPPPRAPAAAAPSTSTSGTAGRKPATTANSKPANKDAQVATDSDESDSAQRRDRPRLFGKGGLFGGLFGGGN